MGIIVIAAYGGMLLPRMNGNKLEFTVRVEPKMYRILSDMKDPSVPFSTFCAGILANAIGYKSN